MDLKTALQTLTIIFLFSLFYSDLVAQIPNPEITVPDNDKSATVVAFSSDNLYMATAAGYGSVKLFDASSRRELRSIPFTGMITSLSFRPDGKILAISDSEKILLVETATGKVKQILEKLGYVTFASFDSIGRLFVGSETEGVRIYNGADNQLIGRLNAGGSRYSISLDGQRLAAVKEKTIDIWDVAAKQPIAKISEKTEILGFVAVALSPDGQFLISGSLNGDVKVWDTTSAKELRTLIKGNPIPDFTKVQDYTKMQEMMQNFTPKGIGFVFSSDGKLLANSISEKIIVWDWQTGKQILEVKRIEAKDIGSATANMLGLIIGGAMTFTPESKFFVAERGKGVEFFEIGKPTVNDAIAVDAKKVSEDSQTAIGVGKFSERGNRFGLYSRKNTIYWNLSTGRSQSFQPLEDIYRTSISPDGKFSINASLTDKKLRITDLENANESIVLGKSDGLWFSNLSADGRYVADIDIPEFPEMKGLSRVKIWDVVMRREFRSFPLNKDDLPLFSSLGFANLSPDGKLFPVVTKNRIINLLNVDTGRSVSSITAYQNDSVADYGLLAVFGAFSPDGKMIAIANDDKLTLWDAKTGSEIKSFNVLSNKISGMYSTAFSPDGKLLFALTAKSGIKIWQIADGKELAPIPMDKPFGLSLSISADGQTIALNEFGLKSDLSEIKFFNVKERKEVGSLYVRANGDWVMKTPDGRFDTNRFENSDMITGVFPDEPSKAVALDVFLRDYYEPRLLSRILNGEKLSPVRDISSLNYTQPKIKQPQVVKINSDGTAEISVEVENTISSKKDKSGNYKQSGVFDVRLFRDGQLVGSSTPDEKLQNTFRIYQNRDEELIAWREASRVSTINGKKILTFKVKLPTNPNNRQVEFSAYALNEDRIKSDTVRTVYKVPANINAKPIPRKAYVITFGVNKYANAEWNLQFAGNDARAMREIFSAKLRFRKEFSEVVEIPLISDDETVNGKTIEKRDATKGNVKTALDLLSGKPVSDESLRSLEKAVGAETLAKITQANPDDMIMLSFSSHGYADKNGIFYILPTDIGKDSGRKVTDELLRSSISSDELSLWLRNVDAGEIVMIVDACHAASAVEGNDFKPAPMGSRGLGQLAFDKGMKILTATQAANAAIESSGTIGHGLLTYALLREGLDKSQADFKAKDKTIKLKEWLEYGEFEVPKLYEKLSKGELKSIGRDVEKIDLSGNEKTLVSLQTPTLFDFTRKNQEMILVQLP